MIKRNQNRSGYKETKVGWIPIEWKKAPIKNIGNVITGSTPSTSKLEYYSQEYMFVAPGDLGKVKYIKNTQNGLSKTGFQISRRIPKGSILFTCIGSTIGKIGIAGEELTTNQQINSIIPSISSNNEYLYYALVRIAPRIKLLAGVQAVPIVNKSEFASYPIPLPPLPEQKKIAEILSAWDRAIEQARKLIDARKRLKKGLMQQLFTSRIRFPEFGKPVKQKGDLPEGWKEYRLHDCFKERNETNPNLQLLSITSDRGVIVRGEVERKDTSNVDKSKYKRIVPGDIGYNTMRMWQGVSAVSNLEGIISPAYTVCQARENHSSRFYGYLFKYPPIINLFFRFSQGLVSDTLNLKFHHFALVKVVIPSFEEQEKISETFRKIDAEIELYNRKVSQLSEQKKGLMQKLLTGEIRTIKN